MHYLCFIYAWAMEYLWQKYELSGRAGRALFGKIGKMRGFRKIRKLMINALSTPRPFPAYALVRSPFIPRLCPRPFPVYA